jgi:hypothetical protein
MNLSTQTPAQIDAKLAELYFQEHRARQRHDRIQADLREAAQNKLAGRAHYTPYDESDVAEAFTALRAAIEAYLPLEAEYERRPWQRYWHVTNANGHIHTSQSCTSCFYDTQYAWRTDLSGLTDVEVVEREAYNACSVCMPIAPAEQKAARERHNAEQREAKRAERQAKQDAKAAKALDRARKHALKVEKALYQLTGHADPKSAVEAFRTEWSEYGHDGRKNLYDATIDLPAMVGNTLSAMMNHYSGTRGVYELTPAVKTALTERGLI